MARSLTRLVGQVWVVRGRESTPHLGAERLVTLTHSLPSSSAPRQDDRRRQAMPEHF